MYKPRQISELSPMAKEINRNGIVAVSNIFSVQELAKINNAIDPIFFNRRHEARSYVRSNDMVNTNIVYDVLSPKMLDIIFACHPAPVLYHLHVYEIAGNQDKAHIFSEVLDGWHRDPDCEFFISDPTHISIFVHLKDVEENDGAFEFSTHRPDAPLTSKSPYVSMVGPAGTSFVWNRSYFHRASPNRNNKRRRILKISIQPNFFYSQHLENAFFKSLFEYIPSGNPMFDILLGRYFRKQPPNINRSEIDDLFQIYPDKKLNASTNALNELNSFQVEKGISYDDY